MVMRAITRLRVLPALLQPTKGLLVLKEAQEQIDVCSYARQLSGCLGVRLKPLHVAESSDRQAVFCLPDWDQKGSQHSLKSFHLPGLRLALFADGEQLTWWCDCHHTLESACNMFATTDYLEQPSDWLEARPDKCVHIKALEVNPAAQLVPPPKHQAFFCSILDTSGRCSFIGRMLLSGTWLQGHQMKLGKQGTAVTHC
jgi:hypothetical protein